MVRRYGYARSARRSSYDYGRERAAQHIREAEELSRQLGGTDKDVKDYFFSLPASQLKTILDAYESQYGKDKRDYAQSVFHEWRTGRRKMSGLVASRLFNLLPPRMPIDKKYELIGNLWREMGPQSHKIIRIGQDAAVDDIIEITWKHVQETVNSYTIPQALQLRFQWLTGGDVNAQQQLLNHFRDLEKQQTVELSRLQIPRMLDHMRNHSDITGSLAQVLQIGKHKFELHYDRNASGVSVQNPRSFTSRSSAAKESNWLWWVIGAVLLIWFLSAA